MKKLLIAVLVCNIIVSCASSKKTGYTVVPDKQTKVLKGYINRSVLEGDTTFNWFAKNMKYGQADATAVEAFKNNSSNFNMVVFGGTWCSDTQNLLPVFYRLVEKSGYPEKQITLIAVDRDKKTVNHLETTYNVTHVPTFIVMKNGKEVGRVVEYGKDGQIDKELGEIVAGKK